MSQDSGDLEKRVEELEEKSEELESEIGWLRRMYEDIADRLRTIAGHLRGTGKGGGENEK